MASSTKRISVRTQPLRPPAWRSTTLTSHGKQSRRPERNIYDCPLCHCRVTQDHLPGEGPGGNMAVAGIDVGSQSTKVVILEAERILAAVTLQTGESGESEARQAMEEALRQARLKLDDMKSVVSTGAGRMSVPFAQKQRSVVSCLARGAYFLYPQARTVLDAGAENSTAIRLSDDGTVEDSVGNDKCAAGAGVFLDTMSRMLRIPLAELGAESLKATNAETLSSTCAVFAESEVVSLVHRNPPVPIANILAGIHQSVANRLFGLAHR